VRGEKKRKKRKVVPRPKVKGKKKKYVLLGKKRKKRKGDALPSLLTATGGKRGKGKSRPWSEKKRGKGKRKWGRVRQFWLLKMKRGRGHLPLRKKGVP